MSDEKHPDEALLERYLLDELSPEEVEAVAERTITDKAFGELAIEIEESLVGRYVDGTLSVSQRAAFEASLQYSSSRRNSIMIQALLKAYTALKRRNE